MILAVVLEVCIKLDAKVIRLAILFPAYVEFKFKIGALPRRKAA